MSVINETLENLKNTKPRTSGALNPSSSAYCETSAKAKKKQKPYILPLSFAMLLGLVFVILQIKGISFPHPSHVQSKTGGWFGQAKAKAKAENVINALATQEAPVVNALAQAQYYDAMNLLNEGNAEQAIVALKKIIDQYPDFKPAQNAYNTLKVH